VPEANAGSVDWLAFFMENRIESRANLVKSAHVHFARKFGTALAPVQTTELVRKNYSRHAGPSGDFNLEGISLSPRGNGAG